MSRLNWFASITRYWRLRKYPRTPEGRRNYIQDSMEFTTPWYMELLICIVLSPIILIILLGYFIYCIVTGLLILICAYYEGFKELWRARPC